MDTFKTLANSMPAAVLISTVATLNRTERGILRAVIDLIPAGSDRTCVCNKLLAKAVGKSLRTIQNSIGRMMQLGLLRREPINRSNPFSQMVTAFSSPDLVAQIQNELSAEPTGKPARARGSRSKAALAPSHAATPCKPVNLTVNTETFPFRSIRDPARFAGFPKELNAALESGRDFWSWMKAGFETMVSPLSIQLESQSRSVRNGERGGPIKPMRWMLPEGPSAIFNIEKYASLRAETRHEGTFRLCGDNHPLLLIDDVPAKSFDRLPGACALLETSPGSFQATLIAPRPLTKQERLFAQRALIDEVGGDPGANNASQLRRFPGSINNKPGLARAFITRVHRVPATAWTLEVLDLEVLIARGSAAYGHEESACESAVITSTLAVAVLPRQGDKEPDRSPSGRDFALACKQITKGIPDDNIIAELMRRAAVRKKGGGAPGCLMHRAYAQLTVRNARAALKAAIGTRTPTTLNGHAPNMASGPSMS